MGHIATGRLLCLLALSLLLVTTPTAAVDKLPDSGDEIVASGEEIVVVRSGDLPLPDNVSAGALAQRAVLRAFLHKHPNYVFKPFVMPRIQGQAMDTAPLMGISSGNPPHAIYVNFRQSSTYISHGFLEPLETLLARLLSDNERVRQWTEDDEWIADPTAAEVETALQAILDHVPEPVWPVIYRDADTDKMGIPQGRHIWAMPTTVLAKAMVYRKDVFQQAGLDPRKPPKNWDELLQYGRQIKSVAGKFGITFGGGPHISYGAYSFLASSGATFMARDDHGDWRASFNTPEMAEAIYFLLRLVHEPFEVDGKTYHGIAYIGLPGNDANLKWERGQVGMQFTVLEDEMLASINPELVGIAPIPDSPRRTGGGELNARMLGVFRETSPAQKLAVMRYIWFVASEEAQKIRARVFIENGYGRFVRPDLLEQFGYHDILRRVPKGWQETYQQALEHGVPEPYGKNTQFIYNKVSEPINWALQQPLLELPEADALARISEGLDIYAERVDKFLLGELTEEEWAQRRTVGVSVLLFIVIVFSGSLIWVWRIFTAAEAERSGQRSWWAYRQAYLMITPALAIVLFWQYLPLLMGAPLALFDYELVIESTFVGIDNFATILYDTRFWSSLGRTFYWVLLTVGLGFWPPIFVAILLDEVPTATLKYLFRTIFYLPTVVSGVIMVFLWRQLYEPSESGFFNQLLMLLNDLGPIAGTMVKLLGVGLWLSLIGLVFSMAYQLRELTWPVRATITAFGSGLLIASCMPVWSAWIGPGELAILARGLDADQVTGWSGVAGFLGGLVGSFSIEPLSWVDDPDLAMLCVVLPTVWATAGPGCIIYLAALKTVPEELIEAATMDGAGIMQRLAYITLPRVKFLILIQLVGAIVGSFKGGTNFILAMTGGGPNGATRVLGLDIFERTFLELHYGLGAAMAWVLGAMVIVLTAYQLKRMSEAEFSTADTK
ncbi:MAG: extracellular solute-binding protein [Gemmatimonadetes bacterium]|nr:extracellular solute-binding protein [Gemmatimonadota bacterium]MBT5146056.1 extracellular solute-binding protein [Gemmatimonadota bacterium]MBT6626264.1 extracellular solute-binding protein [Gemmatimonadota bacterium]MBT7595209.1 extracellular solute-binding protein [Gemmatimonadota bacterium]